MASTVALDGSPRVRTLVFRGWADGAVMELLTLVVPSVAQSISLARRFAELACGIGIAGRALWGWPQPGSLLDATAHFPAELEEAVAMPDHFQLLRIDLGQVELLELRTHPHQRRRWRSVNGWNEELLNP